MLGVFFLWIGTDDQTEIGTARLSLVNHFVGVLLCHLSPNSEQCPVHPLPIFAFAVLDIADMGFCRLPLSPPLFHKIEFDNCHIRGFPPLSGVV
jgi:hypothetical protein